MHKQFGGTFFGLVLGVLLGLAGALAVAVYVTKVPIPFVDRGIAGDPATEEAEKSRNKDWDPNASLGKVEAPKALDLVKLPEGLDAMPFAPIANTGGASGTDIPAPAVIADPLGNLARAKLAEDGAEGEGARPDVSAVAALQVPPAQPARDKPTGPPVFFVQAGAFTDMNEAESQRAKLAIMGVDVRVTGTEKDGITYYRVRSGPYRDRASALAVSKRLTAMDITNGLVASRP